MISRTFVKRSCQYPKAIFSSNSWKSYLLKLYNYEAWPPCKLSLSCLIHGIFVCDYFQGFDFLCLSAGGTKHNSSVSSSSSNRGGNNEMGSLTQLHVPYLQTLSRHQRQAVMSFSLPQTHYSSSQYPDQLSTAQQQVCFLSLGLLVFISSNER